MSAYMNALSLKNDELRRALERMREDRNKLMVALVEIADRDEPEARRIARTVLEMEDDQS